MTQPETKTVLGRVFTWRKHCWSAYSCDLKNGQVLVLFVWKDNPPERRHSADLYSENDNELATGYGPTESDAILALQSTLRKMAELEVVE
jgi:hypothetical protein